MDRHSGLGWPTARQEKDELAPQSSGLGWPDSKEEA
jgi:hypothetical protein